MSKKKDFEYSGKLNEVKQTDDDLKNGSNTGHQSPNQPTNQHPYSDNASNDNRTLDNNSLDNNAPEVKQHNDDLENDNVDDKDIKPQQSDDSELNNGEKEQQINGEPNQTNNDINNPNTENSTSRDNSDEDANEGNNQQVNDVDNDNQKDVEDNTNDGDYQSGDDSNVDEDDSSNISNTDDDEIKQQDSDDLNGDEPKQESEDSSLDDNSIKDKALNKIDPNLSKASKFKDLASMNKEDAKEELIEISKSLAKKKIAATLATYLLPIILPILGVLLAIIILLLTIITATNIMDNNKQKDEGCSVVDKSATNIKNSKDAEKNAKNIYQYAKKNVKGSTNKGIASWLGNINEESGGTFSSSTIQGGAKYKESLAKDPSAGGYAFGFAQLDSDRRVKLLEYADKKDKKWSDMDLQLDYILNHDGTDSDLIKKLIKKDSDISTTTADIMNDWERAGAKDSLPKRQAAAKKYYSKFSKMDDEDSNIEDSTSAASDNSDAGSNSGCNNDSNDKIDGELGSSVKANDKSGEIIKKWKSKDDIPKKYKKYVSIPDFKQSYLKGSPFASNTSLIGQCTELTWAYMSAMWKGEQPTNGNGGDLYNSYKSKGAKVTSNPTVGYGFSSFPPYAGAGDDAVGHTGVVAGVLPDGKWIMANYNLNLEAPERKLTYALVDGNKKKGGVKFFSGVGGAKIKSK